MSLNINRSVADSFYRYKMPAVIAKVEGKGNGIKTVIVNMTDVAKALARPPGYVTKFFGCELGSQTVMDVKVDRYIVNGEHTAGRFQELLDEFIKKYVLCANCGNPETNLYVTKGEKLEANCLACGHVFAINMTHKLTSYILKNPPNDSPKAGAKGKPSKEERRAAKRGKGGKDDHASGDEDDTRKEQPSPPAVAAKEASKEASRKSTKHVDKDDDDGDWSADTSEEAVKRRAEMLAAGVVGLASNDDLELAANARLEKFYTFVQARLNEPKLPAKDIIVEAERLDVKDKGVMVLVELLLDTDADIVARAKTHAALFQRILLDSAKGQKYFLGALEMLAEKHPKLVDKFGHVLKGLYDLDIVEEEAVLEWGAKVSKKYVSKELATKLREKAEPFLVWLREAEEEESEEEEDVVSFAKAADGKPDAVHGAAADDDNDDDDNEEELEAAPASEQHDDEDDIDIDAI